MKDVGTVELGAETYGSQLRFQGIDAVGFGVTQLPSANALDVERGVRAELDRLALHFPPGLKYQVAFNTTQVVAESIREVLITLAEAIALVVLVMFLFLQSWRSTLIPTITIPVSLIGAFAFVKLMDFSINTLTLFGIILATGIVVDDAIVVIENIERHIQEYRTPARQAASDAMREVFGAVIATALVLVAVFVPVAFFPGTTGRLYAQFSMTIAFSVALSAFNALTLTPALSALLLDRGHHGKGAFFSRVERVITAGTNAYVSVLSRLLPVRWLVVLVFVGLPRPDAGGCTASSRRRSCRSRTRATSSASCRRPRGRRLQYTGEIARQAEQILLKDPEVLGVFSVMGFSFSGAAPNQGLIFTSLKPFAEREGPEHSAQTVINRVFGQFAGISGANVFPTLPASIPGLGAFGGFEFQVLDQGGTDINALANATYAMAGAGNQSPRLRGLFTSFTVNDPQLSVEIDRDRALALGLPVGEITNALQIYLGSQYVNDFDFNNRAYRVYVQADKAFRSEPNGLKQFYVRNRKGQMIPLESVVRVSETTAPQVISHFNLFRSASINGSAAPGFSSGQALQEMQELAARTLPQGMSYAWSGLSLEESKAGRQSFLIFGLALLLVYLTLAAQYESLVLPFIVLLGVPLAVLGALAAQWARGFANDVYCQIGLVMLIGLAAKNSILIVEFAEQLRHKGATVIEAAVEAARIRLRPILMTSLAFILGVLPLVVRLGRGRGGPELGRHRGRGRDAGLDVPEPRLHSGAVCRGADDAGRPGAGSEPNRRGHGRLSQAIRCLRR